ncbi:transposase [Streptomyces spinoverrucosus]|uniref:transposase n=1 Tax=Streptomyces spinoverrucosus TaxID=284043 RepID=UPI003571444F
MHSSPPGTGTSCTRSARDGGPARRGRQPAGSGAPDHPSPWEAARAGARLEWRMQPVIQPTVQAVAPQGRRCAGLWGAAVHRDHGQGHPLPGRRLSVSGLRSRRGGIDWCLFLPKSRHPASPGADPPRWPAARSAASRRGRATSRGGSSPWTRSARPRVGDVPLAVADGKYADAAAIRLGLQERGLHHVGGISTTVTPGRATRWSATPPH